MSVSMSYKHQTACGGRGDMRPKLKHVWFRERDGTILPPTLTTHQTRAPPMSLMRRGLQDVTCVLCGLEFHFEVALGV